ncbi:hypothetical protein SAMN04489806_0830 [Paramicrobacterium humi]|uniref:CAAX prenyl protease 2/Lysostaphin resistance protein A-like domain-containing protein n=1 Tax=Paramicrobacterium humi TaxID=640635 RepID=A0A1H4JRF8_9MICO|nr:CPBP family intramembrane glutamic endopeptidase [Microbacterium humi]SEB48899.1 hypothetical protein SAMN04489806_0830 [Microbacterium humi]
MPTSLSRPRPGMMALLLFAVSLVLPLAIGGILAVAAPGMDSLILRLIAVLVGVVLALTTAVAVDRRLLRETWAAPVLLIVPLVVALAPFVTGLRAEQAATAGILVIGYLATGVYEEFWFRGLMLRALRDWTPLRAALVSSGLFGLAHLANIAFGANIAVTLAQVVGAACFGVGFAALRLRGAGLWQLALLHALTDIGLALTNVGGGAKWGIMVGGDVALLIFGLLALRGLGRDGERDPRPIEVRPTVLD